MVMALDGSVFFSCIFKIVSLKSLLLYDYYKKGTK